MVLSILASLFGWAYVPPNHGCCHTYTFSLLEWSNCSCRYAAFLWMWAMCICKAMARGSLTVVLSAMYAAVLSGLKCTWGIILSPLAEHLAFLSTICPFSFLLYLYPSVSRLGSAALGMWCVRSHVTIFRSKLSSYLF